MTNSEDYTIKVSLACVALIVVLLLVSFVPPTEVCGVELRRANILSEVLDFDDDSYSEELSELIIEDVDVDWEEISESLSQVAQVAEDSVRCEVQRVFRWECDERDSLSSVDKRVEQSPLAERRGASVLIEDFDTTESSPLRRFYGKLARRERVRIAFLGDSFVEGDILTADLREQLQLNFDGSGVGFAPAASPLTGFRRTIKTLSKGWESHNIMQWSKSSTDVKPYFTVAGWVCRPSSGASVRWEMTTAREKLDPCQGANIYLISRDDSRVEVLVNDTLKRVFDIEADEALRVIEVRNREMHSLQMRLLEGESGFIAYGAQFVGDEGVTLDNYSVRSNNGRAMFWSSPSLNAQLNNFSPYDLVVLQYGLNIMQQGVHGYSKYSLQLEQMVTFVRECFPEAAVLIMGVSDRWVKDENGFAQMDAIPSMLRWQREAARNSGAAFWNTCEAMSLKGSMESFVSNGWAGKDYTHINYKGGREIGRALFEAIYRGAYDEWMLQEQRRLSELKQERVLQEQVLDSLLVVEPKLSIRELKK